MYKFMLEILLENLVCTHKDGHGLGLVKPVQLRYYAIRPCDTQLPLESIAHFEQLHIDHAARSP